MKHEAIKKFNYYLLLKNKGLRKESQSQLDIFIHDYKKCDKMARREILQWLYKEAYYKNDYNTYLPHNLVETVLKPEILSWISEDPMSPIPYRFTYEISDLRKSLEIDPHDENTIRLLGEMTINKIRNNQHDVSKYNYYHGTPQKDIETLNFYLKIINQNEEHLELTELKNTVLDLLEIAEKIMK
ncbi:MAG TPA: hypothetical protein PLW44_18585, partial [Chitinophagales bacterium]|nr:hypothetical protein [Chitinophagales bacterium]